MKNVNEMTAEELRTMTDLDVMIHNGYVAQYIYDNPESKNKLESFNEDRLCWMPTDMFDFDGRIYRIKPEPTYKPYTEIQDWMWDSSVWLKTIPNINTTYRHIEMIDNGADSVSLKVNGLWISLEDLFDNYERVINPKTGETSPCGEAV